MKYLLLVVIGFISFNSSVYAETVINYDDGSTYTLSERENPQVSCSQRRTIKTEMFISQIKQSIAEETMLLNPRMD